MKTWQSRVDKLRRCAALCALGVVAACGGGGGGEGGGPAPDPGVDGAPYFPLAVGNVWLNNDDGHVTTTRVTATRTVDGNLAYVLRTEGVDEPYEEQYVKSATGVTLVPAATDDEAIQALGSIQVLRFPLRVGTSHVAVDRAINNMFDFDGDGRADGWTFRAEVTVVGFERLALAVGSFDNSLRVRTLVTQAITFSGSGERITITATSDEWYAPGVGLVQSQTVTSGSGAPETSSLVVQGYRVGALTSDAVAPAVATRTPTPGSTGQTAAIRLSFSEAIALSSLPTQALRVRGPTGQDVAGRIQWTGDTVLAFVPEVALDTGTYTATLMGTPEDLLGNRMALPVEWQFSIDASGPTLVAQAPAADATDVPVNTAVTLTFDEPVDPASVTATRVSLFQAGVPTAVPATLRVEGRVVTLTPQQPLRKAVRYTVHLGSGLTDMLGNALQSPVDSSFISDTGRFALPESVPALASRGVVLATLADLDLDGSADLLVAQNTQATGGSGHQLRMVRRLADGSLAAVGAGLPVSGCDLLSMSVADLDGNGLPDVATAHAFGCYPSQALQTTAGNWTRFAGPATQADEVQAVTLVASARPGLANIVGNTLRLWRPDSSTGFQPPEDLFTGLAALSSLRAADLNGDGRMDLVLSGRSGLNNGLVFAFQRADGSFDIQTLVSPTVIGVAAAADVNGDGRVDLLLSELSPAKSLLYLRQTSTGTLAAPERIELPFRPWIVRLADLNGDGLNDIVYSHSETTGLQLHVHNQRSDGGFVAGTLLEYDEMPVLPATAAFLVGDFTGDGRTDLLVGNLLIRQRAVTAGASALNGMQRALKAARRLQPAAVR